MHRVLRLHEGSEVALFDGRGRAARAVVETIEDDRVALRILDSLPSHESPLELTIAVAVPKGDKMPRIVQHLTELGVARIVPLLTERGEVDEAGISRTLERLRRIALESCKQCGRSRVPELTAPRRLSEVLFEPFDRVLLAHPGAGALAKDSGSALRILVFVGPEGGWSEEEIALARSHSTETFGVGPRTLRTETAAIVVASLLQWLAGDLES